MSVRDVLDKYINRTAARGGSEEEMHDLLDDLSDRDLRILYARTIAEGTQGDIGAVFELVMEGIGPVKRMSKRKVKEALFDSYGRYSDDLKKAIKDYL